jgi:magnesium-transporting ATPase (P-type)
MGIAGTDVAKNASDIVLLDDNFRSIVRAILWGRNVFDCIRKFLQFQLGVNMIAIVLTIVGAAAEGEPPLSAVQLLWVNLIMDTFGALALATDPPDLKLLTRAPHKKTENIITLQMLMYMAGQFLFQMTVLLFLLFGGHLLFGVPYRERLLIHTYVFCAFVLLQVFNMFHARILDGSLKLWHGVTRNPRFCILLGLILVVQVLMVTFAGAFLKAARLGVVEWLILLALTAPNLLWGLLVRLVIRRYDYTFERRQAVLRALEKDAEEAHLRRRRTWAKMRTAVFLLGRYKMQNEEQVLINEDSPPSVAIASP